MLWAAFGDPASNVLAPKQGLALTQQLDDVKLGASGGGTSAATCGADPLESAESLEEWRKHQNGVPAMNITDRGISGSNPCLT